MKTNVAVELDGCGFTLDESAFGALRAYLDKAAARLGAHPDRDEVLARLERSIANKLGRNRGAQSVIDATEMTAALAAVGRVDGPALDSGSDLQERDDGNPRGGRRRLYRLRDGQKIAGVCTGLSAFTGIDVSLIRLGFIMGTLFSGGTLFVAYIACMFLMPVAPTTDEIGRRTAGAR